MGGDYYNILKVSRNVTEDDHKKSNKRLAMRWHPDKNPINKKKPRLNSSKFLKPTTSSAIRKKRQIYDL